MEFRNRNTNVRKNIFTDVPRQFPAVYREDGPLFVNFMQSYYEYVDTRMNDFRDAYNIRDIDTTYERFLIYFKEKYLKDIPLDTEVDTRFIVKHIQDLYRRKGSEESLRLLFRLFFDEEIEIYYPSTAILKPSDSKYGSANYLEMQPVSTFRNYPIRKGDSLFGDSSKARGFADEIVFRNFNGVLIPIVYISNVFGKFVQDDGIQVAGFRTTTLGQTERYEAKIGKVVRSSITSAAIQNGNRTAGNSIGDILQLRSSENGVGATASVLKITETVAGVIDFVVEEGGFGYSANTAENDVYISNQAVITSSNTDAEFLQFDIITASNAQVVSINGTSDELYANNQVSGTAEVIRYDEEQNVLFLRAANSSAAFGTLPIGGRIEATNTRTGNTFFIDSIARFNNTASYEIGNFSNIENVTFIADIVGDYESVRLDANNYGMSGEGTQDINTTLRDAFTPVTMTVGEVDTLNILNEGIDYRNDVASVIRQEVIANFDLKDYGLTFDRIDFVLQEGDVVTQEIQVEDLTYQSNTVSYTVRAEFLRRENETFYFRQKSFFGFDRDVPVNIRNNLYDIESLTFDTNSKSMGTNAEISGRARFELGQIEEVQIVNTGFRYRDGEIVDLIDASGNVAARAQVRLGGPGFTEGRWTTTTSSLNEQTKVIHDNDFYQEYSYEISSIINPNLYENLTRDIIQVAGTKQFNAPLINSINSADSTVDIEFEVYDLTTPNYEVESNTDVLGTETYPTADLIELTLDFVEEEYTYDSNTYTSNSEFILTAVIATLDEATSNTVSTQIGS